MIYKRCSSTGWRVQIFIPQSLRMILGFHICIGARQWVGPSSCRACHPGIGQVPCHLLLHEGRSRGKPGNNYYDLFLSLDWNEWHITIKILFRCCRPFPTRTLTWKRIPCTGRLPLTLPREPSPPSWPAWPNWSATPLVTRATTSGSSSWPETFTPYRRKWSDQRTRY